MLFYDSASRLSAELPTLATDSACHVTRSAAMESLADFDSFTRALFPTLAYAWFADFGAGVEDSPFREALEAIHSGALSLEMRLDVNRDNGFRNTPVFIIVAD